MTQQQISTPSVLNIDDTVILSSNSYPALGIPLHDPWDTVLTALENRSLAPATDVAGMDNASSPNAGNPFITYSYMELKLSDRGLILIGQPGSNADYEGTTDAAFTSAIASLPASGGVIAVLAGTYTFNSTVSLPENVCVQGVHPLSVTIQGAGNFPVFTLSGDNSRLEFLTIENPSATSFPVINLTGDSVSITGCRVYNYQLLGVRMVGSKSCAKYCLIDSDASGIWLQGLFQFVENCSFSGLLVDGVLRFENTQCSALSNFIQDNVTGPSYIIPSPSCVMNKLVANHFGTLTAVSASTDYGTGTVRYANTPDTPAANENNFLLALQEYTGQPDLDSTTMTLTNTFAHDSALDTNATTILSSLDLFTQRIYEERSWILTSSDPTFDSVGSPTSGVFSWDGTMLTYPNFAVSSLVPNNTWTITASSVAIATGEALVLNIDRVTPGITVPTVQTLPLLLANPPVANQYVIAFSPASGVLVWTKGFRILTALTSFDVDGVPLPINRFIGIPTDMRNTPVMPDSFAIGDNLTDKLSSQSDLLHNLYEKTNLYEYSDNSIDMTPQAGSWLSLTNGQPETPSHLLQMKGTTYALFPNNGIFRWVRETAGENPGEWGVLVSNPAGVGPFASLTQVGTNIAALTCTGAIVIWDVDALTWTTIAPTTSLSFPLPNTRPVGYDAAGQCDFTFQTPYYSLFTLLDGRTLLYFQTLNTLVESHRVFTEMPKGISLLGRNIKDTGFNVVRNNWIDTVANGANSTLQGLPLSGMASPAVEIPPQMYSSTISTVKWDTLAHESFSYEPNSSAFLEVAYSGSTYYVISGGLGGSKLLSIVLIGTTTGFTDFIPHGWLTNVGNQEVICFGTTISTSAFTVVMGKVLTGSLGSPCFGWVRTVLGGANSSTGAVGVVDRWNNQGTGNVHILTSDLSRISRPTWWIYTRATSTWSSNTLADAGGSITLPQAVAGSFTYNALTDQMAGYGIAASSIRFLVRDTARANRPTLFAFDGTNYSGIRLSEFPLVAPADVAVAGADGTSTAQFYGGVYQNAWETIIWVTNAGSSTNLIMYFVSANIWSVMSVGSGGTYLPTLTLGTPSFTKRTGSLVATPTLSTFVAATTTQNIFIWTQSAGLLQGSLTGYYLTGISGAVWTQFDQRQPPTLPIFSSTPMTTYSPTLGVSRCDLSIQIGSLAEKTLPIFGAGLTATTGGLQWFQPGTKVKQISSTLWAGLNRNGYLWIGNLALRTTQLELTPSLGVARGDVVVTGLGITNDFDWSFDGSQAQVAFVFKDLTTSHLNFVLYDITETNPIVLEHGLSGVAQLGSTPQIGYNVVNNSWSIVAQDTSASPQLYFFRRLVISSTWVEEHILPSGSWKTPAKPLHYTDGSTLIVTASGGALNALLSMRTPAGVWSTIYTSPVGGFATPSFTATGDGTTWWIFGGNGGSIAYTTSGSPLTGWTMWSGSPSLASVGYTRVSTPVLLPLTLSVVVATSALTDGVAPASRELLIWRFENSGAVACLGAFTAKGRLQSGIYSSEEEDGITDLSWTVDQRILYGATRPTRTTTHWSLRGSTVGWNAVSHGDSLLGSGRFITLGERHFREQWGSAPNTGGGASGQDLIIEYPSLTPWTALPLAIRLGETDFTSLNWTYAASSGSLFTTGSMTTGLVADSGLASGALVASSSRSWPLIMGSTRWSGLSHTGPSVFAQGSMLGLYPPLSTTNLAYFGNASIGSNNLLKIQALASVTFNGTRTWSASPTKQYVLIGPVTYLIDTTLPALGSHLVLQFNTASSLTLDAAESPLSYWSNLNYSNSAYAVVVGEVQSQTLLLYPAIGARNAQLLTYGHLEPIEITSDVSNWIYSLPYFVDMAPLYSIMGEYGSTIFALQEVGSLRGVQPITFTPSVQRQLVLRRLLPMNGWFLYQSTGAVASSARINALASLTNSIVTLDKISGELP